MTINFRAALATLSRALTVVLFRAGIFVAGGFMVIVLFGMLLFAFRLAGGASSAAAIVIAVIIFLGWSVSNWFLQRFFLYRHQVAMLFLFSGRSVTVSGFATVSSETWRLFPDHASWLALNRKLRHTLFAFYRGSAESPALPAFPVSGRCSGILDQLTAGLLGQAILVLGFAQGGMDAGLSARKGLALYFRHGMESRRLARQWLWFSVAGQCFLFLCFALPNWFFFSSTGAPVVIGIVLAAVIARVLHQAFVLPFVLAGVCGSLLAGTLGKIPDPGLCEKLGSLISDTALPEKRAD